jgi:hypothetical protein
MNRWHWIVALALILVFSGPAFAQVPAAQPFPGKNLDLSQLPGLMRPGGFGLSSQKYQQINWQTDMKTAIDKAKADGKPLMVFLVVNQLGSPNSVARNQPSAEC